MPRDRPPARGAAGRSGRAAFGDRARPARDTFVRWSTLIALGGLLAGCGARPPMERAQSERLRFVVFDGAWIDGAPSGERRPLVVLRGRDIERYEVEGDRARFVLSRSASERVHAIARGRRSPPLDDLCSEGRFVVELDSRALYEGRCYPLGGAAYFEEPTLHIVADGDRVVLQVGAQSSSWSPLGSPASPEARARIDPAALHAYFGRVDAR